MLNPMSRDVQVAVVGAGPAGAACALALATLGSEVALVAPAYHAAAAGRDTRTTALLTSSVALLENLGAWEHCADKSEKLETIRIIDDRGGLLRAPEVLFDAAELGQESFGANIANTHLNAALNKAISAAPAVLRIEGAVTGVAPGEGTVRLDLAGGESLSAALVVAADGRGSIVRTGAGIGVRTWQYPQAAIATSFRHSRPHKGGTIELHRRAGPLTTVPLPGNASSLVWVEEPAEAQRLGDLPPDAFADALLERLQGMLGAITDVGPRVVFTLSGLAAEHMARGRVALIGEAAHVFPPIGAQGLNLGLRDACVLAECVAADGGGDAGRAEVLQAYQRARQVDVASRTLAVDALNRSLLVDFLPVQALRGAGLHLLANLPPLRRAVMQGGMTSAGPLPRLMQPKHAIEGA